MADSDDLDDQSGVEHLVEDPVVADSNAVHRVLAGELGATRWAGLLCEQVDRSTHPLLIAAGRPGDGPDRPASHLDLVTAHSSPSIAFTSFHGT